MTPQSHFMVLAAVEPSRGTELRHLLETMNLAEGRVDPHNRLIPFARFPSLHFARLLLLDDKTTADRRQHDLPDKDFPLYLAFLGDVDGDAENFLDQLINLASDGLRAIFSCCTGFSGSTDLREWLASHSSRPSANYVNCRGRTVTSIHEEAALRNSLLARIAAHPADFKGLSARESHAKLREFLVAERSAGRIHLTPEEPTPFIWKIRNILHLIFWPTIILILSPILICLAPFYIYQLRRKEHSDPELCDTVDQEYSDAMARAEDHDVTNAFSAMGSIKPGIIRLITLVGVLATVDYAARHLVRPGRLGRIRTIHFARWVFLDGTDRMVFFSNYDGSVESYMDDFINKTGFGLNASFSNGIGYPATRWLVLDGCGNERKYKEFLRRHTLPTQVWYKAYPGLTAIDLERNSLIRRGLESESLGEKEAREWVSLL